MKRKPEEKLKIWKDKKSNRKPLLLTDARQVGKAYLIREFGREQFKNTVYFNLETNGAIAAFFDDNI